METLPFELQKLGLKRKEAGVYLAILSLKYSPAQKIAKEARISRPTVYEVLENLKKMGLISEQKEKGKRYFFAESPDKLLGSIKTQKKELEEKERELLRIIAELRNKYQSQDNQKIQNYRGKNAIDLLLEELETTNSHNLYVLITDEKLLPWRERKKIYQRIRKRLGNLQIKEIDNSQQQSSTLKLKTEMPYLKTIQTKTKKPNFRGVAIISDKVLLIKPDQTATLISCPETLKAFKSLFEIHNN